MLHPFRFVEVQDSQSTYWEEFDALESGVYVYIDAACIVPRVHESNQESETHGRSKDKLLRCS